MDFIMTTFMYPLDMKNRPRIFGKIYFDNPRTTEEVNYVAQRLMKINLSEPPRLPDKPGIVSDDCVTLMSLYDFFYKNNKSDELVEQFNKKYGRIKDIYKKLARMWIVVRSEEIISEEDTKGKFAFIKDKENDMLIQLIEDFPLSVSEYNQDKINDIFAFITLMLSNDSISNHLLNSDNEISLKSDSTVLLQLMNTAAINADECNPEAKTYPYGVFRFIEPQIIKLSEAVGKKYSDKKFLYICKKIHHLFEMHILNQDMAFVEIISILEMLITHNPDSGRFNVEDSITKQFVGKLLLIIYENNNDVDLEYLKKELKFAKSIRSAIAHGDFDNLENQLNKLFEFYNYKRNLKGIDYKDNSFALATLLCKTHDWVKEVINLYLEDEKRLELIKTL